MSTIFEFQNCVKYVLYIGFWFCFYHLKLIHRLLIGFILIFSMKFMKLSSQFQILYEIVDIMQHTLYLFLGTGLFCPHPVVLVSHIALSGSTFMGWILFKHQCVFAYLKGKLRILIGNDNEQHMRSISLLHYFALFFLMCVSVFHFYWRIQSLDII